MIEAEEKKQQEMTEEIARLDEEKKQKNKVFDETTTELNADADDLDSAVSVVEKAIAALNKYTPAADDAKTRFHDGKCVICYNDACRFFVSCFFT